VVAIAVIGLVPRELFAAPAWWIKLAYALALAGAAAWLAARLARPAAPTRLAWAGVAVVVLAMAAIGLAQWGASAPSQRVTLWLGHSWQVCPSTVFGLSLPALALAFWALRGLAPTNPRRAGLAAGLEAFRFWLKLGFISFGGRTFWLKLGRPGRSRSCTPNWSSAGAGSASGASCMR
jgi:hypothetical protein